MYQCNTGISGPAFRMPRKIPCITVHAPVNNDRTGLGLMMIRNTFGIYKETSFMGNYAFRKPINKGIFAMGIGFGLTAYRMAWDRT